MQGSVQVMVGGVDVGAGGQQSLDAVQVSPQRREVQRRRSVVVPGVDVGTGVDESVQDGDLARVGGVVQRSVADGVPEVDVCLESREVKFAKVVLPSGSHLSPG